YYLNVKNDIFLNFFLISFVRYQNNAYLCNVIKEMITAVNLLHRESKKRNLIGIHYETRNFI
ncbi:hypothetical protein, partial [Bacteroides thetaiotaomicron]|uniref:hypothetical protein n=1 Tax=Bacteroides thetaiotaomicron TaxID=818 RepID=UPI001E4BFE65